MRSMDPEEIIQLVRKEKWMLVLLLPVFCMFLILLSSGVENAAAETVKPLPYKMLGMHMGAAVLADGALIYASPTVSSAQRGRLTSGTRLDPVEQSQEWCYVKASGVEGYMRNSDIVLYDRSKKQIALTFDDGPSVLTTHRLLDTLEKTRTRATFFVLGGNIGARTRELVRREVSLGCEIGSHAYNHPLLTNLRSKSVKKQLVRTDRKIKWATGKRPTILRPPYGGYNKRIRKLAGRPIILWSVDTLDWKYRNTNKLIRYMRSHRHDGAVVLMHDIHASTVRAVPRIIKELKANNYEMVTVSELAAIKGKRLKSGTVYLGK